MRSSAPVGTPSRASQPEAVGVVSAIQLPATTDALISATDIHTRAASGTARVSYGHVNEIDCPAGDTG
jgi:hypothetical protein